MQAQNLPKVWSHSLEATKACTLLLEARCKSAAAENPVINEMLQHANDAVTYFAAEASDAQLREEEACQEVGRLRAELKAVELCAEAKERSLQRELQEQHQDNQQLQAERDDALLDREEALTELAAAYHQLDSLSTAMSSMAKWVQHLRSVKLELDMRTCRVMDGALCNRQCSGACCMQSIRAAVKSAVREASCLEPAECNKRMRSLQLRWHPDKNPFLKDLATEVTKRINEAMMDKSLVAPARASGAAEGHAGG